MFREFDYENKPVVEIVNEIIEDAISKGASDIHFDPDDDCIHVRIRIDGELHDYAKVPDSVRKNLSTRIKIISGMNITESRLPQDGAIKYLDEDDEKTKLDLRVSSLPTIHGEKIVIRILDYSMSLAGIERLGFSQINLEKVIKLLSEPNGIIIVAGATGTGKSTTVYSMLQKLNTSERNIITVEDPVEMKMPGINQVQVMSEIGLDFTNTLRSILRQDPDVIMIGEIRDRETARIAVRASITGHLVLSTIHTNNSLNTIERLLDMDIERYLLGTALNGIVSQRLVKKLCPKCRKSRPTTPYEKNLLKKVLHKDIDSVYEPCGCDSCFGGYRGRLAIHEVLLLNQDVRDAITNNIRKEELRKQVYKRENAITLLEDGLEKVVLGYTSIEEILRVISVEEDFGDEDADLRRAFIGNDADKKVEPSYEYVPSSANAPEEKEEKEEIKEEDTSNEISLESVNTPLDLVKPEVQ